MEKAASEHKVQTICLVVIATAIVTYMVYWLRPVLVPFVIALFVVSGVTPILELFEKHLRVNRLVASVIAFVAGLFALAILAVCLWASVRQIGLQGDVYKQRVGELLESTKSWLPPSMLQFVQGGVAASEESADGENADVEGVANENAAEKEVGSNAADSDSRQDKSTADTLGDSASLQSHSDAARSAAPTSGALVRTHLISPSLREGQVALPSLWALGERRVSTPSLWEGRAQRGEGYSSSIGRENRSNTAYSPSPLVPRDPPRGRVVSFDPDFVETNDPEQTASDNQGNAAPSGNQGNAAPSGNQGNAASGEDESTEPSQATLARQASLGDQAPMGLQLDGASIREPMQIDDQFNPDYKASFEETAGSLIRVGLMRVSGALLEIFSTSVVVLIYVFFILLGSADAPRAYASIQAVDRQVRSYLMMKTIISIFTGVAFGVALAAFGVPMALTFGLLAFLLNYIPNVGPVVASLLPIPFILLGDGSAAWMVSAIVVTMSIQIISGNVVEPKLMGDTSDLHPVVILLALMFWGMMWGVTGMFLATPITAGLKIVLEGNEVSRPMSDLLAGRWGSSDKAAKTEGSNGGHGSSVAKA